MANNYPPACIYQGAAIDSLALSASPFIQDVILSLSLFLRLKAYTKQSMESPQLNVMIGACDDHHLGNETIIRRT